MKFFRALLLSYSRINGPGGESCTRIFVFQIDVFITGILRNFQAVAFFSSTAASTRHSSPPTRPFRSTPPRDIPIPLETAL